MYNEHLPVYYLGHLVDVLNDSGFPVEHWLASHNLTKDSLYQSSTKISTTDFDNLLSDVLSQPNLEHIGLTVGKKLQIAHHGTFGLAILNCETVEQIIQFVQKFLVIRIPFIELSSMVKDDKIIVLAKDTHWQGRAHRFVIEVVSGAMFNIFKALQARMNDLYIQELFFDYPAPDYQEKYAIFEPIDIAYEHGYCGLTIKLSQINRPIPNVDKLSFLQAQQACQTELDKYMQFASVKGKVQQLLMQHAGERMNLNMVSEALHMSQRSLHRRLIDEHTSFKKLLEEHQSAIAKECLLVYGYSVSQTAQQLGFVDIANFRRAFKRWYNCTPSEFLAAQSSSDKE